MEKNKDYEELTIQFEENVRYTTEVTIKKPNNVTMEQFELALDMIERSSNQGMVTSDDIGYLLEEKGFKVIRTDTGYPHSPDDSQIEIVDVR